MARQDKKDPAISRNQLETKSFPTKKENHTFDLEIYPIVYSRKPTVTKTDTPSGISLQVPEDYSVEEVQRLRRAYDSRSTLKAAAAQWRKSRKDVEQQQLG